MSHPICHECGFDREHWLQLERAKKRWERGRNALFGAFIGSAFVGQIAQYFGASSIASLLVVAGGVSVLVAGGAILRTRMIDRQLHAARQPKALPEARLV